MTDDWERDLERLGGAVRPTGAVAGDVREVVRRRRRRRRTAGVAGVAAAVAAVVVTSTLVAGGSEPASGPEVAATASPSASPDLPHSTPPPTPPARFTCPRGLQLLQDAPPIADLAEQQAVVADILRVTGPMSSVRVLVAQPTALGVVVLVQPGLADATQLLEDLGASYVHDWDPGGPSVGLDEDGQVRQVLQWQLEPVVHHLNRVTHDRPGNAGLALWQDAGAVVLQWQAPVPAEIEALAGVLPSGVEVQVWPVTYSDGDVRRAQDRLPDVLVERGLREEWTSSYGCADHSGLVVGMVPPLGDRATLEDDLTRALGMPVLVVPEQRPVERGLAR